LFEEGSNEIRSLHGFMADFFVKYPSIKDFSSTRVPYHYDQAHMYKELIAYLRSPQSREVGRVDRQAYLRVRIFIYFQTELLRESVNSLG
jgi:hypothetical protein